MITHEHLDDLERKARLDRDPSFDLADHQSILRLVAVYRAALAWSEAKNSDDHDAAAHALRDAVRGAP